MDAHQATTAATSASLWTPGRGWPLPRRRTLPISVVLHGLNQPSRQVRLTECLLIEPSPAAQDQDHLAAAAPGQPLPGLGLAFARDLETAAGALQAPAKLQQVPADHPLRATSLLRGRLRLRRRRGRCGHPVEGGDLFPGELLAGLGPSQQADGFGFAGGAGGAVTLSRAAISSLVSFSLGLDRPSSRFLLVMFPLVSVLRSVCHNRFR